MTEEQIEALGEWMANVEGLLQRMTNAVERIEQHASITESTTGDIYTQLQRVITELGH